MFERAIELYPYYIITAISFFIAINPSLIQFMSANKDTACMSQDDVAGLAIISLIPVVQLFNIITAVIYIIGSWCSNITLSKIGRLLIKINPIEYYFHTILKNRNSNERD